ncbi:MAG: Fic family protein [Candidatus Zixiibacteriota bacterium]|nr:MAG: Fic family protein [candidate division Zixibacteria bacterium]
MTNAMTFKETHPWLLFQADLSNLAPRTWIQLGECAAKCDQISSVPLRPAVKDELQLVYLAKGIQATTAIEGNTLTEEEVRKIIEKKSQTPPSREYLEQEIENILKACNLIAQHIRDDLQVSISPQKIREYNLIVLENLSTPENVRPGEFRQHNVSVGRYLAPNPGEVHLLVEKLCNWLNGDEFKAVKGHHPISLAIIKAIIAHLYISWIHPFGDGNGRTARLIEFKILAQSGVPLPAAHLLSNHYNSTRTEYYNQLERTSKAGGRVTDFVAYAVQGFLDGLNEQLGRILEQQIQIALENFIHDRFREKPGETWRRRRHLALDLAAINRAVSKDEIPLISKRINHAYKDKNPRTISRDLDKLMEMRLIERIDDKYLIDKRPIMAFLPVRKTD